MSDIFMEFLVSGLSFLVKQKKLQPAEQIISEKLSTFETSVPSKIDEKEIDQLENLLISVMTINDGDLSIQFCHRLAECFVYIYSLDNAPKIFNLVTFVQKNPSQAAYFTIGFVVNSIGDKNKAMMNSLTESLLKAKKNYFDSALFALNYILKVTFSEVKKYAKNFYSLVEANVHHQSVFVRLLCIKILRKLIKSKYYSPERLLKSSIVIYYDCIDKFVREKAACYVADCLVAMASNKDGMKEVIQELVQLTNCTPILSKFCQFVDNAELNKHAMELLNLIRSKDKHYVKTFALLLSIESKKALFEKVEKEHESEDQLEILRYISYDTDSDRTVAAIASKLMVEAHDDRSTILSFYDELATKNFELARELLYASSIFLAYPPESYDNLGRHLIAMSLISAQLITSNKSLLTQEIIDNIGRFQDEFFPSTRIFKGGFIGAFITARALKVAHDETVRGALNRVLIFLENPSNGSHKIKLLGAAVSGFLAFHKFQKSAQAFMEHYLQIPLYQQVPSALAFCCVLSIRTQLNESMFKALVEFCLSIHFSTEFLESKLNVSTIPVERLLGKDGYKFKPTCSLHMSDNTMMKLVFDSFPHIILKSPEEVRDLTCLCHNEKYDIAQPVDIGLLLAMAKNKQAAKYIPEEAGKIVLRMIKKLDNDIEICACGEIAAAYISNHPEILPKVMKYERKMQTRSKAILCASLLNNVELTDNHIMDMQQELCDLCKSENAQYAFFGLAVLFQTIQFSSLAQSMAGNALHFLVGVFNTKLMLNPIVCYYAHLCFNALMPLVSSSDDSASSVVISEALQCLAGTKSPFCRAFYLRALSQALHFAKKSVSNTRLFLASKNSFSIEVSSSCGAVCDMRTDEFDYMNTALFHLQLYTLGRIQEYITANAEHSDKVKEWVNLVKDVISFSVVPGTSIEARNETKQCILKAMKFLIPRIKEKLDTESLDDTITALIKVVTSSTSDDQMMEESFDRFSEIIDTFSGVIKLEVYDSQFAIALRSALNVIQLSNNFLKVYVNYITKSGQLAQYIKDIVDVTIKAPNTQERTSFSSYLVTNCIDSHDEQIIESAKTISKAFEDNLAAVFRRAIESREQWQTATEFRDDFGESFGDIIVALVFALATTKSQKVTYEELCNFLIDTSSKSTEKWRIDASIRGIVATFEFLDKLDDNYRSECLKNVPKNTELTLLFEKSFSRQLEKDDKLLNEFFEYVSNAIYDDEVYARIVKNAPHEFIEQNGPKIFDLFVNRPNYSNLCSLLFLVSNGEIYEQKILAIEDIEKKLSLAGKLVLSTKSCSENISEVLAANFDESVLILCGRLLQDGKTADAAKIILNKVKDLSKIQDNEKFAIFSIFLFKNLTENVINFAELAVKKLADIAVGFDTKITKPAEFALKILKETDEGRHLLRVLSSEQLSKLAEKLENAHQAKANASKFTLKTFGNARKSRETNNSDWVALDGSSSDDEK